jgi:hypothetical protein
MKPSVGMGGCLFDVLLDGETRGRIVYAEDAAAFVAILGQGAKVYSNGRLVWSEGEEAQSAAESYDVASEVMRSRAEAPRERRSCGEHDTISAEVVS